ncbi:hypothetical protein [Halocatena marina]|uniref:Uncharacterized protein n=1 Tax=Halocatena marina TaxID=2934937 RepID=A0ABD5YW03_9EURY|nr:hypothetical protein [Halocatena marina]
MKQESIVSVVINRSAITIEATIDVKGNVLSTIQKRARTEDCSTEERSLEEQFIE